MIPAIVNLQRKVKLEMTEFRGFAAALSEELAEAEGKHFAAAFVSDERMRELNSVFRGKDATTDVLSFPFAAEDFEAAAFSAAGEAGEGGNRGGFLGDIVISAEQAARQATENELTLENEIKQLMLHGLLHLCGYDHETDNGEMEARELEMRAKLGI